MTDWTAGYVADIGYTYGYYPELNPLRVRLAFLNAGLVPPEAGTACELGFGQGVSANMHAAASVTQWFGTDFNPAQAGFAQQLAAASGSGARLYDEAFADFCHREDLPEFDYIGLHGIWSWISEDNRGLIVEFIRRKLKVGGVLYISYNTLPGWAAFAPMRHLLTQHAEIIGSEGHGIVNRINGALAFADKLLEINPGYARANPQVAERFKQITGQSRHYLAHEYFNRDWHPMHFAAMAERLSAAKLTYACSANYIDHLDVLNLSADQKAFLKEIPDANFRETVRDFMVNQQFRRDYWVKGMRRLNTLEQAESVRAQRVVLTTPRQDVPLKISGALGEADMSEAVYGPILDVLGDHRMHSIGELEVALSDKGVAFAQTMQAILVLTGGGNLALAQDNITIAESKKRTEKLNAHLINRSRGSGDINHLASPVTGGGISASRPVQLFLLALTQGKNQPMDMAAFAWQFLGMQGQKIIKDGKLLETAEENLNELSDQAVVFIEKQLPILTILQVV